MSQRKAIPAIILLFFAALPLSIRSQENTPPDSAIAEVAIERAPTSAEVMRDRISRAKAMLAVRNFAAAIYELENIRRENTEPAVNRVVDVLLMHSYLELSDYPKAQKLLKETRTANAAEAPMDYLAVAGQVVNGARSQVERYKSLGLNINDRNLPTVATADIEGMRMTLEMVVEHSKEMTAQTDLRANAAALLEESSAARGNLARDAYDARRWKDQVADAREQMISSRSVVLNAMTPPAEADKEAEVAASRITNEDKAPQQPVAAAKEPVKTPPADAVAERQPERRTIPIDTERKPQTEPVRKDPEPPVNKEVAPARMEVQDKVPAREPERIDAEGPTSSNIAERPVRIIRSAKSEETADRDKSDEPNVRSALSGDDVTSRLDAEEERGPLPLGSLIGYATRRVSPIYPRQARNLRMTGVVTVRIVVDEDGSVTDVSDSNGPALLTKAAEDAIRKWKFKPFVRDGQPVKATGFVSFNFNL